MSKISCEMDKDSYNRITTDTPTAWRVPKTGKVVPFHPSLPAMELSMPVQFLKGVGPARAAVFATLGVHTVADLLEYFPRDWVFAPPPVQMRSLQPGQDATIIGLVESTDYQSFRSPPLFEAMLADDTGICRIVWFHGSYLRNQIQPGQTILASGKVNLYKHQLQLANPKFIIVDKNTPNPADAFSGAIYPASAGLSSIQIKQIIRPVIEKINSIADEFYDSAFLKKNNLIPRPDAFAAIHNPADEEKLSTAKRRLKFDELFLMQLGLALRRYRTRHFCHSIKIQTNEKIDRRIRKRFPFLLTEDQDKAIAEIVADMAGDVPMNRLLQGDVGSGKTVVALYAALLAVANKKQVAIMAPTEILANQHFISIERYLKDSSVKRLLITGGITGKKRKEVLKQIRTDKLDIVVGTVALLQKDIEFKSLGLVIIDEQHKFGVEQKSLLRKDASPHCLVMTATPIPRTLAMTVFGDLDVSVIRHCPPGRGQVVTRIVDSADRPKAYEFIRQRLRAKKQAYFVYPRITACANQSRTAETDDYIMAATDEWQRLSKKIFPEFRVELLHGRMPLPVKQKIMNDFRRGNIDCLVSTVVIEVGVDVPNATIMVIEAAERFGLAQLHQLRGRIGRGQSKSYCLLFANLETEIAKNRLDCLVRTNDGFEIAEHDLRLRGPGELFSTRQHGLPDLKIANIIDDYELLVLARRNAFDLAAGDPMLTKEDHKKIRSALIAKFGDSIGLVDIA
jgi:ATP-dependent DNA helicase RecG